MPGTGPHPRGNGSGLWVLARAPVAGIMVDSVQVIVCQKWRCCPQERQGRGGNLGQPRAGETGELPLQAQGTAVENLSSPEAGGRPACLH